MAFKHGDKIKVAVCPECGNLKALYANSIGNVFYCSYCKKSVKSLKIFRATLNERG